MTVEVDIQCPLIVAGGPDTTAMELSVGKQVSILES